MGSRSPKTVAQSTTSNNPLEAALPGNDDAGLMAAFYAGDEAAFACLTERWKETLFDMAQRQGLSRSHAEDAVQEAFVKVYLTREKATNRYAFTRPFGPWIRSILRHECINVSRRERKHWAQWLPTDPMDTRSGPGHLRGDIDACLTALTKQEREFIENWNQGLGSLKQGQIAHRLGVSDAHLSQTIKPAALAKLRRLLEQKGYE